MKKIVILTLLGHLAYLYVFHSIFLPSKIHELIFIFISSLFLILSFYFSKEKKHTYSIVFMILYSFSFSFLFLLEIFLRIQYYSSESIICLLLLIFSICALIIYIYDFVKRFYIDQMKKQRYIYQMENNIYENYIHVLRHDYNKRLYQITNDIKNNDSQKALDHIKHLIQDSYQNNTTIISTTSSLNYMFQLQINQYKKENISFRYYICKIDSEIWDEKYTICLYHLLDRARVLHNEVTVYLQTQDMNFICRIISIKPIEYSQVVYKKMNVVEKKLEEYYLYTIKMPFSS